MLPESSSTSERDGAPVVLLIDDAEDTMRLVTHMLQVSGFRVLSAESGPVGISIAEKYSPNAILLDVDMPGMNGFETCAELKSLLSTADIPVIFVTGSDADDELIRRCYSAGAHDLIHKPVRKTELICRLQVVLREQALREAYRLLATQDPQTGVNNRRQFFLYLAEAIIASRREQSTSVLILADIDKVGLINDKYGFDFGDEIILTLARILKRFASSECRIGRVTGDTMAVILKDTTPERAVSFCQRIRQTFGSIAFDADTDPKHFTASFGLAKFDGKQDGFDVDEFMSQADIALFEAKKIGRGALSAFWELDQNSLPDVNAEKRHSRCRSRKRSNRAFVGAVEDQTPSDKGQKNSNASHEGTEPLKHEG